MTNSELQALAALSIAESIHHQIESMRQQANGEMIVPYGGPYGYDRHTQTLMLKMEEKPKSWKDICGACKYNRTHWVHAPQNYDGPYEDVRGHVFVEKK